jgi:predicted kinase
MPNIHILIGLPGSGKSYWRSRYLLTNPTAVTLSTDDMVDAWATERGLTYSEAFEQVDFKTFNTRFKYALKTAVFDRRDIIVDRTNMSVKARRALLDGVTVDYTAHAVVFVVPDEVLKVRLKERAEKTGKVISEFVIKNMANSYVAPSKDEGFETITYVR